MISGVYQGKHTTGCHKCGGYPNSPKKPVSKLFQCQTCGFITCNKHLSGGISKECPNCKAKSAKLRVVMTKQAAQNLKAGGLSDLHRVGKKQRKRSEMDTEVKDGDFADAPATDGGGGGFGGSGAKPSSDNTGSTSATIDSASNKSVDPEVMASLQKRTEMLEQQLMGVSGVANMEKTSGTPQQTSTTPYSQQSAVTAEQQDEHPNTTSAQPEPQPAAPIEDEDDAEALGLDLEALEAMESLLSAENKIIQTDSYFRISSYEGVYTFENYCKSTSESRISPYDNIQVISVDAGQNELLPDFFNVVRQNSRVFGVIGHGPRHLGQQLPDLTKLASIFKKNKQIIALGEIGLDLHFAPYTRELQEQAFTRQLDMAKELGKAVFISSRKADRQLATLLRNHVGEGTPVRGVFVPPIRTAEAYSMVLEHDLHVLIRPEITYREFDVYRESLLEIPPTRWLLAGGHELTAPSNHRGSWNKPEYLADTLAFAARFVDMKDSEFLKLVANNFNELFNSDPEANDDEFDMIAGEMLTVSTAKLLENDVDADGDVLMVESVEKESVSGGFIAFDRDSEKVTYMPPKGFIGTDTFRYTITDGRGGTASAKVIVRVKPRKSGE